MIPSDRPARVLVVDDEQPIRAVVRGFLEREGMTVAEAADGPAAVDAVRAFLPDVVVLDIMLPGFDGLEVLLRVRAFADPLVIFLTARTEEIDRIVGLRVGGDDYLTKPFSPGELVARVQALLRRQRPAPRDRAPRCPDRGRPRRRPAAPRGHRRRGSGGADHARVRDPRGARA